MLYNLGYVFFTKIDHEPLPMGMIYKPWGALTKISARMAPYLLCMKRRFCS